MPKTLHSGVHVRLENYIDKRKNILESALLNVNLSQKYEDFKIVRNEKAKQISLFKKIIKEINLLFKDLEYEELPEVKISKKELKEEKIIKDIKEKSISKTKLEVDLEDIKNKLENLKI